MITKDIIIIFPFGQRVIEIYTSLVLESSYCIRIIREQNEFHSRSNEVALP